MFGAAVELPALLRVSGEGLGPVRWTGAAGCTFGHPPLPVASLWSSVPPVFPPNFYIYFNVRAHLK